jgi:hypothetical protein
LKTIRYLVLMSVLSTTALLAQSYTFEAASVKLASPDNPPGQGVSRAPGGRFTAVNAPLRFLIMYAYQLQGHQLVGAPDWIATERFDIVAKMEGDPPTIVTSGIDPMRLATRTLARRSIWTRGASRDARAGYLPLSTFASGLSNSLGRAVVDRTGLMGNWAFDLTYAPEPSPDSDVPGLLTAIQEELGLKLEATKGPVEVLVIDTVSRPTPD